MKNKIRLLTLILAVLFAAQNSHAQVPDTPAYVKSIVANKNKYIGKPFANLEKI